MRTARRTLLATPDAADQTVQNIWRTRIAPFAESVPDVDVATFVAKSEVHSVIHDASTERPELVWSEILAEELVTPVERYLMRSGE